MYRFYVSTMLIKKTKQNPPKYTYSNIAITANVLKYKIWVFVY